MTDSDVYYFSRFVPAYRVPILEKLNERLDSRLVVCSGDPPGKSSFNSLVDSAHPSYRQVRLPNIWIMGDRLHYQPFRRAFRAFGSPDLILAEESPRSVSQPRLIRYAVSHDIPLVLWGHFSSNMRPLGSSDVRDRRRLRLASRADALVGYTDPIVDELSAVFSGEKLFVARNTVDTEALGHVFDRLQEAGRESVRERLGLTHDLVVVFLGRLVEDKGTPLLVETLSKLPDASPLLLVIGEGPERARLEREATEARIDIRFTGTLTDPGDLGEYLFAADVLFNPGYLGLSIVHAFSMGLPVVGPAPGVAFRYHSPEWVYVRDGRNGLLVQDANPGRFAEALMEVNRNRDAYSSEALRTAREELTVHGMIDGLLEAMHFARKQHE